LSFLGKSRNVPSRESDRKSTIRLTKLTFELAWPYIWAKTIYLTQIWGIVQYLQQQTQS